MIGVSNYNRAYIESRTIKEAEYIIANHATLRETAEVFDVSRSTVSRDMHNVLKRLDKVLYRKVMRIIKSNKEKGNSKGGKLSHKSKKSTKK